MREEHLKREERYSKDVKFPKDNCLHWNATLNKAANPPPFLSALATFMKLKRAGTDSLRAAAPVILSSQVSVNNIKSRLWEVIRLLIKNDLSANDLTLSSASFSTLSISPNTDSLWQKIKVRLEALTEQAELTFLFLVDILVITGMGRSTRIKKDGHNESLRGSCGGEGEMARVFGPLGWVTSKERDSDSLTGGGNT